MEVKVKNNNATKAYRVLKRKLQEDGWHKDLSKNSFFVSKKQKHRLAKKIAVLREKRRQIESEELLKKQELRALRKRKKTIAKR